MAKKKNSGYLVETKTGKKGKIFHDEKFINNKIVVHIINYEHPILCTPESIKIVGYFEE